MLPLKQTTTAPKDDAWKKVTSYGTRKKINNETKLPLLWNHHEYIEKKVSTIGLEWLQASIPQDIQVIIVAYLKQNKSDSQRDYIVSSVQRTFILGFSKDKRDLFSEIRKYVNKLK